MASKTPAGPVNQHKQMAMGKKVGKTAAKAPVKK